MKNKPTAQIAKPLLDLIAHQQSLTNKPCFVALDGGSGSGKSSLAAYIASNTPSITIIEGDEFYTGGNLTLWLSRTANENARCCIDWKLQHSIITSLKFKGLASWYSFDWQSNHWDSDIAPHCATASTGTIADIVLLEGVYSARQELSSLFDLRIVLEVPTQTRKKQLITREQKYLRPDWEKLWSDAEQQYFDNQLDYQSLSLILN